VPTYEASYAIVIHRGTAPTGVLVTSSPVTKTRAASGERRYRPHPSSDEREIHLAFVGALPRSGSPDDVQFGPIGATSRRVVLRPDRDANGLERP